MPQSGRSNSRLRTAPLAFGDRKVAWTYANGSPTANTGNHYHDPVINGQGSGIDFRRCHPSQREIRPSQGQRPSPPPCMLSKGGDNDNRLFLSVKLSLIGIGYRGRSRSFFLPVPGLIPHNRPIPTPLSGSAFQGHPCRKRPAVFDWNSAKGPYRHISRVNPGDDIGSGECCSRIVIRTMPLQLKINKAVPEVLNIVWEFPHDAAVFTLLCRKPVIDRAIGLLPGGIASVSAGCSNKTVSAIPAHLMKNSVISSA